jgi:hypothetical protein
MLAHQHPGDLLSFESGRVLRAERSEFIERLFERFAAAFFP